MKGMKGAEAPSGDGWARRLEQCFAILLEARARECIVSGEPKGAAKARARSMRGARYENAQVTFMRPEAVVSYA